MTYDFYLGPTQIEAIDYILFAASIGSALNVLSIMYYVNFMPARSITFANQVKRRKRFLNPGSTILSDEDFENFYSLIQHIFYLKAKLTEEEENNSESIQLMINEVNNEVLYNELGQ